MAYTVREGAYSACDKEMALAGNENETAQWALEDEVALEQLRALHRELSEQEVTA